MSPPDEQAPRISGLDLGDPVSVMRRCSNWGRWGSDDELGTLNHITPAKRLAALQAVREGVSVSISRALSTGWDEANYDPIEHRMIAAKRYLHEGSFDWVGIAPHGYGITHLDALAHNSHNRKAYNGRRMADVWSFDGLRSLSITAQKDGILTRGVLLDVAAARGVDWLTETEFITPADLDAAEERAGVEVGSGDAVLVHMGLRRHERSRGAVLPIEHRAGLSASSVEWLFRRDVAVYGGDCVERLPYPSKEIPMPLHLIGLVGMGLVLLDWPDVDVLTGACARFGRREFLLTVAPLVIPGGTGSAVNPICTF